MLLQPSREIPSFRPKLANLSNDDTYDVTSVAGSFLSIFPSVTLIVFLVGVLCWSRNVKRAPNTSVYLKYSGHEFRWILTSVLVLVHIALVVESVLKESQFYLPLLDLTDVALDMVTLYVSTRMERLHLASMSSALVVTWLISGLVQAVRACDMILQLNSFYIYVRFYGNIVPLLLYVGLFVIDARIFFLKVYRNPKDREDRLRLIEELERNKVIYLDQYSMFPRRVSFWWIWPLLKLSQKDPLSTEILGAIPKQNRAVHCHLHMRSSLKRMQGKSRIWSKIWYAIFMKSKKTLLLSAIFSIIGGLLSVAPPLILKRIINLMTINQSKVSESVQDLQARAAAGNYFMTVQDYSRNGVVLVMTMAIVQLIYQILDLWSMHVNVMESQQLIGGIQGLIFEKMQFLSRRHLDIGIIANHMTADLRKLRLLSMAIHNTWSVPLKVALTAYLLYRELGVSCVPGVAFALLSLLVQYSFAKAGAHFEKSKLTFSDVRVKRIGEMLSGIRYLKMSGFEETFCESIMKIRNLECNQLAMVQIFTFMLNVTTSSTPYAVCVITFLMFNWYTGLALTPAKAFFTLTIIKSLGLPLTSLSKTFRAIYSAIISFRRIEKYLNLPVMKDHGYVSNDVTLQKSYRTENVKMEEIGNMLFPDVERNLLCEATSEKDVYSAIKISNATFAWDDLGTSVVLKDINLNVPKGKLTMIVGSVGSGKTALLSAILGEIEVLSGSVSFFSAHPDIAYSAQKPWILNTTLKKNITMHGEECDPQRYLKVIKATALEEDLRMLPAGDETEIGEQGINLSGGQKHRVSLARAIYSDCDIVILDDPFSSLDVHVGSYVFRHGILELLTKTKKTVVMVTNSLQYLSHADQIILLADGRVLKNGTLEELEELNLDLLSNWRQSSSSPSSSVYSRGRVDDNSSSEAESLSQERDRLRRQAKHSERYTGDYNEFETIETNHRERKIKDPEKAKLIEKEDKNRVTGRIYLFYVSHFGRSIFTALVASTVGYVAFRILFEFWLSAWTSHSDDIGSKIAAAAGQSSQYYLPVYIVLFLCTALMQYCQNGLLIYGAWLSSCKIFQTLLRNISRVPLRVFDVTPKGRILNRFTSDVGTVDMILYLAVSVFLSVSCTMSVIIVINVIISPLTLILFIIYGAFYVAMYLNFVDSIRDLTRLESQTVSPILSITSETLSGVDSVRAYRKRSRTYVSIMEKLDIYLLVGFLQRVAVRWLLFNLCFLSTLSFAVIATSTIVAADFFRLSPSLVGLAISSALDISSLVLGSLVSFTLLETALDAVQRLHTYSNIPNEDYSGKEPPANWPDSGQVLVENLSVKYAVHLDPVLRGVSFVIASKQKIGVCGRTGSGKSTLTLSLLRLLVQTNGCITIDGVDIATVPMTTLRERMSMIPQDPVIYSDTIRNVIDIGSRESDEVIWDALDKVQLKTKISNLPAGLDSYTSNEGSNFSMGEKQLICIARAIVRKSKIVIMDEPTASIDVETDKLLQEVIANVFQDNTVITIAHRLMTIMHSDKILVLDNGRVAEYDEPSVLLGKKDSLFASLVREAHRD